MLETKEQARAQAEILRKEWWSAYQSANVRDPAPGAKEEESKSRARLDALIKEAKDKFGNNKAHPDCDYCREVSVFGGPSHTASSNCRSGRRNHCTCDTCW